MRWRKSSQCVGEEYAREKKEHIKCEILGAAQERQEAGTRGKSHLPSIGLKRLCEFVPSKAGSPLKLCAEEQDC